MTPCPSCIGPCRSELSYSAWVGRRALKGVEATARDRWGGGSQELVEIDEKPLEVLKN